MSPASAVKPPQVRPTGRVGIPAGRRGSWWCGHDCGAYPRLSGLIGDRHAETSVRCPSDNSAILSV